MSRVDFEYYPHIIDLIWEHISDPITVHAAGQVCSSWRKRALKVIYRHLSAEQSRTGWNLWMKTDNERIPVKYQIPATFSGPKLDSSVAARHTEILDVIWPRKVSTPDAAVKLAEKFPNLHTMRIHTGQGGDLEGTGATQVYSWFSRETHRVTIKAHKADTLVLLITVEKPVVVDGLFDDDLRLSRQLLQACYAAKDLVVVFRPYEVAPRFTSATLARDVAEYLGVTCEYFGITVVGAETLIRDEIGGGYDNFRTAVLHRLAARNSEHGVRFVTHDEYKSAIAPETYELHCVPDVRWR